MRRRRLAAQTQHAGCNFIVALLHVVYHLAFYCACNSVAVLTTAVRHRCATAPCAICVLWPAAAEMLPRFAACTRYPNSFSQTQPIDWGATEVCSYEWWSLKARCAAQRSGCLAVLALAVYFEPRSRGDALDIAALLA